MNRRNYRFLWGILLIFSMVCSLAAVQPSVSEAAKAKKLILNKSRLNLYVGEKETIKVKKVMPKKAGKAVKYKSNKISVVTVTKKGVVTAISEGTAKITVTAKSNKKVKKAVKVTVRNKDEEPNIPDIPVNPQVQSNVPVITDIPVQSSEPIRTEAPVVTDEPVYTENPNKTADPALENDVTQKPTIPTKVPVTEAPITKPTATPSVTEAPMEWVSTWGTAEENFTASADRMPQPLNDTTVRQIIKVTTSGKEFKLRLSNQYGKSDVTIHSLHIAKQGPEADKSTIDTATDTVVTVGGEEEFVIPAGQVIETDGVKFAVNALENVAVSAYFGDAPEAATEMTGHRGARATTYQVSGNSVSEETLASPTTTLAWYFLADASVMSPAGSKAVVCFGDSITDGYGTDADYLGRKPDSYTRWGDYFAKRLQANEKTKNISVINEGIGSNGMLGSWPTDAGKDRFARDLLEHDGVGYCIILFGVNDLNKLQDTSKYNQLLPEYQKMVELCHENGIKVYGAPILPFGTSDYYSEASEQVRTMINDWMRSEESGMDGIIDFDKAVADPDNPTNVLEKYTHSDGLHPYDGYDVMADAIDLTLFTN